MKWAFPKRMHSLVILQIVLILLLKGEVDHAPQESVGGCSSPSPRP